MKLIAAAHIHSDWSYDGKWPLDRLAREFSARGYKILLMTEHDRGFSTQRLTDYRAACAAASTPDILLVPGIEYSDRDNIVHILTWGDVPFLGETQSTAAILQSVAEADGVAVFAHPARRNAWQCYDTRWTRHLIGAEIWNRKTDGWAPSKVAAPIIAEGNLTPFVGMDFHSPKQFFDLAMELDCAAPPTEQAVLHALRQRQCRPIAFGQPVEKVTEGWRGTTLRSAEYFRRTSARTYRLCKRALAG